MIRELSDKTWYFAGGVIGSNNKINHANWLRLDDNKCYSFTNEYNRFIKTDELMTFIVHNSEYYVMLKIDSIKVRIWKLGALLVRKVVPISSKYAMKIGHESPHLNNIPIMMNKHIMKKSEFATKYKLNVKIV